MNTFRTCILFLASLVILTPLPATAQNGPDPKIVGQWVFTYKGEKRSFQFSKDNTFTGHYAVSGKPFSGTWRDDGGRVILVRKGIAGDWGSIGFISIDETRFTAEGYDMSGHRAKIE
jgi:hypothetical protein